MQPFYFQRAEQSFCTCIIQAIRLTAHRLRDAALSEHLGEFVTCILTAAIAVKDQLRLFVGRMAQQCHVKCIDDQIAAHILAAPFSAKAQPTMRRLNKSITTARYNQSCSVST